MENGGWGCDVEWALVLAGGRDAGTSSGMGAVPLRSAQVIGQPKKIVFFVLLCNVTAVRSIFQVLWSMCGTGKWQLTVHNFITHPKWNPQHWCYGVMYCSDVLRQCFISKSSLYLTCVLPSIKNIKKKLTDCFVFLQLSFVCNFTTCCKCKIAVILCTLNLCYLVHKNCKEFHSVCHGSDGKLLQVLLTHVQHVFVMWT